MRGERLARYIAIKDKAVGLIPGFRWALTSTAPATGDLLLYDGTQWVGGGVTIRSDTVSIGASNTGSVTVTCSAGETLLSCGFDNGEPNGNVVVTECFPNGANGCDGEARNNAGGNRTLTIYAVCLG